MADKVLVERLKRCYWPTWLAEYYRKSDPRKPGRVIEKFVPEDRRHERYAYDVRRTRFFIQQLRANKKLKPIEVDCRWHGFSWCLPSVVDGHHRYAAAVLTGQQYIEIHYGGPLDYLDWLKGDRDDFPGELCPY